MNDLTEIAAAVRACQLCPLGATRKNAVPGEGPKNAALMLIGEGPGFNEDQQGRPFVGASRVASRSRSSPPADHHEAHCPGAGSIH